MTLTDQIIQTIIANPDWDSIQVGRACNCRDAYVRAVAYRKNYSFGPARILNDKQRAEIMNSDSEPKAIAKIFGISVKYAKELQQPRKVPHSVLADRR